MVQPIKGRGFEVSPDNFRYIPPYLIHGVDYTVKVVVHKSSFNEVQEVRFNEFKGLGESCIDDLVKEVGEISDVTSDQLKSLLLQGSKFWITAELDHAIRLAARDLSGDVNFSMHTALEMALGPDAGSLRQMLNMSKSINTLSDLGRFFPRLGKLSKATRTRDPSGIFSEIGWLSSMMLKVIKFDCKKLGNDYAVISVTPDRKTRSFYFQDSFSEEDIAAQLTTLPAKLDLPLADVSYKRRNDSTIFEVKWYSEEESPSATIRRLKREKEEITGAAKKDFDRLLEERIQLERRPLKIDGLSESQRYLWSQKIDKNNPDCRLAGPEDNVGLHDTISLSGLNQVQEDYFYTLDEPFEVLKAVIGLLPLAKKPEHAFIYAKDSRAARRERSVMTAWGSNSYAKNANVIRKMILDDESGIVREFFKVVHGQEGNVGEEEIRRLEDLSQRHALEVFLNKNEGPKAFNHVRNVIGESSLDFLRNPLVRESLEEQLGKVQAAELLSYISEDFVNSSDLATTTGQLEVESNNRVYALTYEVQGQQFTTLVKLVEGDDYERFEREKIITNFFADAFEKVGRYIPRYVDLVEMGNYSVGVRTFLTSDTLFDALVNSEEEELSEEEKKGYFLAAVKDLAFIHHVGEGLEKVLPEYKDPQEADTHPIERTIDRFASRMVEFTHFNWGEIVDNDNVFKGKTYGVVFKSACQSMFKVIANATFFDPVFCKDSTPKNYLAKGKPSHIDYEDELLGCFHQDIARLFEFGINGKEYLTNGQKKNLTDEYLRERRRLDVGGIKASFLGEDTNSDNEEHRIIYDYVTLQKHLEYIGSSVRDFSRSKNHSRQARHYQRLKFHINGARIKANALRGEKIHGITFSSCDCEALELLLERIEEHTRIKVLLVDFGGVFFSDGMEEGTRRLEEEYDVSKSDWKTVLETGEYAKGIRRGDNEQDYWDKILNEECKLPDETYSRICDIIATKEGYGSNVNERVVERIQELWYSSYQPNEEVRDLILAAKANGTKIIAVTSNFGSRVEALIERNSLDEIFDCVLSSHEIGIEKNGKGFYRAIFEFASCIAQMPSLRPEECITIDDKAELLMKAKKEGIHTISYSDGTRNGALREKLEQYHLV